MDSLLLDIMEWMAASGFYMHLPETMVYFTVQYLD